MIARSLSQLRNKLGLPSTFTPDACRHGGMTELEEAELTHGQGRALSGHGYAKRTVKGRWQPLESATHISSRTPREQRFNEAQTEIQNEGGDDEEALA
jgi:hypothetical protein